MVLSIVALWVRSAVQAAELVSVDMERGILRLVGRRVLLLLLLAGCDAVFGLERPPPPPPVPGEWSIVRSGGLHSCAIQTDGSLWCWGENVYGEVGIGANTAVEVTAPARIGTDTWIAVAVGTLHTCAIREDSTLWCWGHNASGGVGNGTHDNQAQPVMIGSDRWRAIDAADGYTCAIRDDQSLWCWGANAAGQLGDGTSAERTSPTLIDGTREWSEVSTGTQHACAVTTDGALWCWGTAPLGPGRTMSKLPVSIEESRSWSSVAAGNAATCAISDGSVLCWGAGSVGSLGNGTMLSYEDARPISSDRTDWRAVTMHYRTACALAEDGTLECWGDNRRGQIGSDIAQELQLAPHPIDVPTATWKAVSPGIHHACAIDGESHLWCTGDNGSGQRGDGTGGSRIQPVKIDNAQWSTVVAGEASACGVRGNQLWCWGDNSTGQLGDGTINARQVPSQTMMQQPSAKLAVGAKHTCSVDLAGRLWCWGANNERQLIAATPSASAVPLNMNFPQAVGPLAAYEHTCAIGADTKAYCWGRNSTGQLGRGMVTAFEATPAPVVEPSTAAGLFTAITAGVGHSCGIATTTLAYCWGRNNEGQVGNNSMQTTALATYLGFAATKMDAGAYHTCALVNGGQLGCWGSNSYGQIGDGTAGFSRPVLTVVEGSTWIDVSAGAAHTCGLKMGGELWCWGDNSRGTLGDGTRTNRVVPVRIGTASWSAVSAGSQFTCGLQSDGSLWCWGGNVWGQLGDGTAWNTRFVQIGMP